MNKCEKLQSLINMMPDEDPLKAQLQAWHDEHCGGEFHADSGGDTDPPKPPHPGHGGGNG